MKTIIKYKALDGKEFYNEKECIEYESLISEIDNIMMKLPLKPQDDGCEFSNGNGYIQHDEKILLECKLNLLNVASRYINHKWIKQAMDDVTIHPSWIGRLIGGYSISPLYDAWYRIMCTDNKFKEWGQPYYANNSGGTEVCLNKR